MAQEVRVVVWQSEGLPVQTHAGCVEVSLSKTPNPQLLLTSWLVGKTRAQTNTGNVETWGFSFEQK